MPQLALYLDKTTLQKIIFAATVKSGDGSLVTHNRKEFNRVDELIVEDWVES